MLRPIPVAERASRDMPELVEDPVCGTRLTPLDSAAELWHDMRVLHFCSARCRDTFRASIDTSRRAASKVPRLAH